MTRTSAELAKHVSDSIHKAHHNQSNLDEETLEMVGFCTPLMRSIYNNLCSLPDVGYLEVGAWHGASLCSAACGNKDGVFYAIENFAQDFGGQNVREDLLKNIEATKPKSGKIRLIEEDFWSLSEETKVELGFIRCNVLMYDGEHSEESQRKALTYLLPYMDSPCLLLVDDASWDTVQEGTRKGLSDISKHMKVVKDWTFHVTQNDDKFFHNGLAIYLLEKV